MKGEKKNPSNNLVKVEGLYAKNERIRGLDTVIYELYGALGYKPKIDEKLRQKFVIDHLLQGSTDESLLKEKIESLETIGILLDPDSKVEFIANSNETVSKALRKGLIKYEEFSIGFELMRKGILKKIDDSERPLRLFRQKRDYYDPICQAFVEKMKSLVKDEQKQILLIGSLYNLFGDSAKA